MTGYYRVNYDTETWRQISSVLMTDHERIHPFNRAQIICDVSHLAAHGAMEQETADLVLEYFTKENVHEIRGMSLFIAIDSVKQRYVCKLIDLVSFKRIVFEDIDNPARDQGLIKGVCTLKNVLQNILDGS